MKAFKGNCPVKKLFHIKNSKTNSFNMLSQQTYQRWYLVENKSWTDVHLSTLFQHWQMKQRQQNYVDLMSMNQCCFSVEIWLKFKLEPTYVYWRCFNVSRQGWNNIERITSIQCRWPNVVSALIFGWKWKLNRRMFIGIASMLRRQPLKQLCQLLHWSVLMCGKFQGYFTWPCTDISKKGNNFWKWYDSLFFHVLFTDEMWRVKMWMKKYHLFFVMLHCKLNKVKINY